MISSFMRSPRQTKIAPLANCKRRSALLNAAGLRTKGARAASWALDHCIDKKGDFTGLGEPENRLYAMGWLLLGAVAVERFPDREGSRCRQGFV